jgi:hypothetical protein
MVAGTRLALGMGLGFLFADRLTCDERRAAGWALTVVGALTTIPLALEIFGHSCSKQSAHSQEESAHGPEGRTQAFART